MKDQIEINLFNDETGEAIGRYKDSVQSLPDTFAIETNLHIADEEWIVVRAEPVSRSEIHKAGKLDLYLKKPQYKSISPDEIRFSLPTITDAIPPLREASSLQNHMVIHEDSWRQSEFVSSLFESEIRDTFQQIKKIWDNHWDGYGFNSIHIRKEIPEPLQDRSLTIGNLQDLFGLRHQYDGVAFQSTAAEVSDGFAFEAEGGLTFFGQKDTSGRILVLHLQSAHDSVNASIAKTVDKLLLEYSVLLLIWPRMSCYGPGHSSFLDQVTDRN